MRIYYGLSPYQSHRRVGETYRGCLATRYPLVSVSDEADVVILHREPHDYGAIYRQQPHLRDRYVIAYCVWEASHLPAAYVNSIRLVQEVWTCSKYCVEIFAREHDRVAYIPHVIERNTDCSPDDMRTAKRLTRHDPGLMYFLSVTKLWDKRKNTKVLVDVFDSLRLDLPNVRLIVKAGPGERPPLHAPRNVTYIVEQISDGQLNALFRLAHAYVSAHHSEGWGLPLSDAMLFGIPVIATGYSGNLEFMNEANAFLVRAQEAAIADTDCFGKFDRTMKWGYPDAEELRAAIRLVATRSKQPIVQDRIVQAQRSIARFNRSYVSEIMFTRLLNIEAEILQSGGCRRAREALAGDHQRSKLPASFG